MHLPAVRRALVAVAGVVASTAGAVACCADIKPAPSRAPAAAPAPTVVIVPAVLVDYNRFEKLSPTGDLLVASVLDGLSVIDLAAGGVVRARLPRCAPRDGSLAFDGRRVVAGDCAAAPGAPRGVVVWDLETGAVRSIAGEPASEVDLMSDGVDASPTGPLAAIVHCPAIAFVDVASGEVVGSADIPGGRCGGSTSWSVDRRWFAMDMGEDGVAIAKTRGHAPARLVSDGATDRWLGLSVADAYVTLDGARLTRRDDADGAVRGEITVCNAKSPGSVTLSPRGDVAAVVCPGGEVWLAAFDRPPRRLDIPAVVATLSFDPSGERLGLFGEHATRVFDVARGAELFTVVGVGRAADARWGRRFERVLRYVEHDGGASGPRDALMRLTDARTGRELGRDHLIEVPRIERLGGGHVGLGAQFNRSVDASWGAEGVAPLTAERAKLAAEVSEVDGAASILRGVPRALPFTTGRTATIRYQGDRARVAPLEGGREIEVDVGPGGSLELDDDDTHAAVLAPTATCPAADCIDAKIIAWPSLAPLARVKLDPAQNYPFTTSADGRLASFGTTVIDLARGAVLWRADREGIAGFGSGGVVVAGADRETRLRDARSGALVASFPGSPLGGESTRDHRYWMTWQTDRTFRAVDTEARRLTASFGDRGNRRDFPTFLDGRPFVIAFNDAGVDVARLSDGAVLHVLFGIASGKSQVRVDTDEEGVALPATSIVALAYLDDGTFEGPKAAWPLAAVRTGNIRRGAVEPLAHFAGRLERPGLVQAFFGGG